MNIQHNIMAMNAKRSLKTNEKNHLKSLEKLNSGYKLNRAADDAAGLSISEKMRAQIRGLNQAVRNVEDGISFVQTAEGALSEVQDMMHRIHELAVQAANDTNTPEDRECLDAEVQMFKEEIDYIFKSTEFNTLKIWDTRTNNKVQIGVEKKQAVRMQITTTQTFKVTETNKGAIAYNGYTIRVQGTDEADAANYGFTVIWEGWNQKQYSSELISWDAVGKTAFGANLSDYVDTAAYPELKGIDFRIAWTSQETATIEDIAKSIDGVRFGSSETSSESVTVNQEYSGVSFSVSTNYLAELASERNVDAYDTVWMEPALTGNTNVISQPSYTSPQEEAGWKIHFKLPNIGLVTAVSNYIDYRSYDTDKDTEGLWWRWAKYSDDTRYKATIWHTPDAGQKGSLLGVTDCITDSGKDGDSLTADAKTGGVIDVSFSITPDKGSFEYEGRTGTSIGTITMHVYVSHDDTEESIMRKIQEALNPDTVFDVYEGSQTQGTPYSTTAYAYSASANPHIIDTPVYKTNLDRVIQAGANAGQLIHISYDSLRIMGLGIYDSNVLTRKDATQTIAQIQAASEIISEQRSLFGAYQNRLEHTEAADANTAENLQESESRIRDTDMTDEAVKNAKAAILEQSIQAVLANANRQLEEVLVLLQ